MHLREGQDDLSDDLALWCRQLQEEVEGVAFQAANAFVPTAALFGDACFFLDVRMKFSKI